MIDYTNYEYDENCVFGKQKLKERLEKQLGDFGEQLVMTLLGRIAGYSVALVDHEGADLIASDKEGNSYAISVKSNQIGPTENETKVFKQKDQDKLCGFAKDFDLIPAVAEILIPKDFAFIDVYLMTVAGFNQLAEKSGDEVEKAIGKVKKGLQINNYSLGTGKKPKHSDKRGYLHYLHTNDLIEHVRLDVRNRESFRRGIVADRESNLEYLEKTAKQNDGNLSRQLGDAGEHLLVMLLGQTKKYKVARVDHVGADLIATDREGKKYAISVKTKRNQKYTFNELYSSGKSEKKELSKLQDFSEKYKGMESVIALVFLKPNFGGVDIYIATLKKWLELGFSGKYDSAIKYVHLPDWPTWETPVRPEEWRENLSYLQIDINTPKKKAMLDSIDSIEHMEMNCLSLLNPDKKWE